MNAFDIRFVLMSLGSFGLEATKERRRCFVLGMRDGRLDTNVNRDCGNDGFQDDCYWAGHEIGQAQRKGLGLWIELAEIALS